MFHYAGIYRQVPTYWNKPRSLNCVPDNCDFSTPRKCTEVSLRTPGGAYRPKPLHGRWRPRVPRREARYPGPCAGLHGCLYAALGAIGIDEEERKARAIIFHSWRHFLNSVSRGRVPDEKLRIMTGHRTEEMTEHYTHLLEEDYTEIRKVQEDVFGDKRVSG